MPANRRVWIVDCETTGTERGVDKVVEVAGVLLDGPEIVQTYQSLVNPGIPIPAKASAVHHLTDKDVADAPTIDAAMQTFYEASYDYVVAHKSDFDSSFMDFGDCPWLCTHKLAHKVFPDAPGYSNQVLRYHLGLPGPKTPGLAPHRALYDAEVTAQLFLEILGKARTDDPFPGMEQVSRDPILLRTVGFGAHYGKQWSEMPRGYLTWIINTEGTEKGFDENTLFTAKYWRDRNG